jgi:hypothetical protein
MNNTYEREDYCGRVVDMSDYAHPEAMADVADILYSTDPGEGPLDWNDVRYGVSQYVDLAGSATQCPEKVDDVSVTAYEFRFYIYESVNSVCPTPHGIDPAGCAGPRAQTDEDDPASGHPEFRFFRIRIEKDEIDGFANHEVGHALGLCDGGEDVYTTGVPCTLWEQHENCPPAVDSVMHSYGCDEPNWPTSGDIGTVLDLIPVGGTGQGGSSAGCGGKAFCG